MPRMYGGVLMEAELMEMIIGVGLVLIMGGVMAVALMGKGE